MTRHFDPEPRRCPVCDVRLHRAEPDHEANHVRADQAKAFANADRARVATKAATRDVAAMEAAHDR